MPEARIKKFSNSGSLKIDFTSEIEMKEDADESIGTARVRQRRKLEDDQKETDTGIVEVAMVSAEHEGYDEEVDLPESRLTRLESWKIVKVDQSGIEIEFVFDQPLTVSHEDDPDYVFVQIALG